MPAHNFSKIRLMGEKPVSLSEGACSREAILERLHRAAENAGGPFGEPAKQAAILMQIAKFQGYLDKE